MLVYYIDDLYQLLYFSELGNKSLQGIGRFESLGTKIVKKGLSTQWKKKR